MEEQQAYQLSTKEKILFVLTQLFFVSILVQYNDVLTGFITGGLMLCCVLFNSFREKWQLLKERKHILWMFAFVVWLFISLFTSKDVHEGFRFLDPRLPLLYFPLTLGLIRIDKRLLHRILLGLAVIVTFYSLACLIFGISNYIKWHNTAHLYNDALTVLTDQQSIYISLLVNFSIYIYAYFIFFTKYRYKVILTIATFFLFITSYMLASRNMMAMLYLSTIAFSVYYIISRKKYLYGVGILLALAVGIAAIFSFFPNTVNRFKELLYTKFDYKSEAAESHYAMEVKPDQWNGANFRLAAWKCGWEVFTEHPVTGTGLGDKKAALFEKYQQKDFHVAIRTKKNVHNNYLDILFGTGIIGFILFITGWLVLPLVTTLRTKNYLGSLLIVTFAAAMITEVYFDRSFGGMLFGFFIPFLLIAKTKENY